MDAATAHAMCRSILEDLRESHSQIQGAEVNNDQQEATRRLFRNGNLVWITQAINDLNHAGPTAHRPDHARSIQQYLYHYPENVRTALRLHLGHEQAVFDAQNTDQNTPMPDLPLPQIECTACNNSFQQTSVVVLQCPDRHPYCRDCIRNMFALASRDEESYPPKCCTGKVELDLVRDVLGNTLTRTYQAKEIEYNSPQRCYCSNVECATFQSPASVRNDIATCSKCATKTCTLCSAAQHLGSCDARDDSFLALADDRAWQSYFRCKVVVELTYGCNHITCRCGAQFCMICAGQWKTCRCEQSTQGNIEGRGQLNLLRRQRKHRRQFVTTAQAARVEASRAARIEAARVEAAQAEATRVEAVRVEAARAQVEAARLETARVEAAMIDAARVEAARVARVARVEAKTITGQTSSSSGG